MRIAVSNGSRSESSAREGSNGRGREGGRDSMSGASGSIASRIGARSNRRGCLSISSQVLAANLEVRQENQAPSGEQEDDNEEQNEVEDAVNEELYERGPALMPEVPRDEDKVVLTPFGDR